MALEARDRRSSKGMGLIAGILVLAVLYFARDVFIPLALAGLLAFLLAPLATRLEHSGLRRTPAALLVIALAFAALIAMGWIVLGQIYNLALELPQYQQNVTSKVQKLHLNSAGKLTSTVQMMTSINKELSSSSSAAPVLVAPIPRRKQTNRAPTPPLSADTAPKPSEPVSVRIEEPDASMLVVAERSIKPLLHPLITGFVVFVFVVFILLGRDDLRDRAIRLAGDTRMHVTTVAMSDAGARVSRYLLMQFVVNVSFGTLAGLALWAIGIPHPLLWAVMACLLRFIPYVGVWMAATAPTLLAMAVSPTWTPAAWTAAVFFVLELTAGNVLEPLLYGASTGISALAILVAAIFWTWIWGPAGLLLSTPLTVCLVVIGRHVPHLQFIGILLGEETVFAPPQRFYQRILASDTRDATLLLKEELNTKSHEEVCDTVIVPSLSLIEEARHSEEITSIRADQILQSVEEIVDNFWADSSLPSSTPASLQKILCVPARDFADEITAHLVMHAVSQTGVARALTSDLSTPDLLDLITFERPSVVCVVGTPPQALRPLRLRCHQIRTRFPDLVIVACMVSSDCDLSNIRSRIPIEDAQHVACSIQQAKEYLVSLSGPPAASLQTETVAEPPSTPVDSTPPIDIYNLSVESAEEVFSHIATQLARCFEAPIALINVAGGELQFWKAHSGLPEGDPLTTELSRDLSICSQMTFDTSTIIVPDVLEDERFASDPFLREKGIRFYAGAPLTTHDGEEIGSICVLDTRPRQITEQQKEQLQTVAELVMNAIELRSSTPMVKGESTPPTSVPVT